jgi:putative transposase
MTRLEDRRILTAEIASACAAGARLAPACALAGIDARTFQRWQGRAGDGLVQADRRPEAVRPRPAHALGEAERARIVELANEPRFADVPPARIVPALADEGVYVASEASFHRVLRAHGQMQRRGRARPPRSAGPPSTHVAIAPGQVWCWEVTFLPAARVHGRWFYLFLILDLYSRKIVGHEVHEADQAEHAAHLARRTALAEGLHARLVRPVLHGDNGASLKGTTVLAVLAWLGIRPSHSRPRGSDDNAYAEALFRTAKCRPEFPSAGFADLDAARDWAAAFVHWYNHEHHHSGIRCVTPAQRHAGQDGPLLAARHALCQRARERNPRRWSGRTRDWTPIGAVTLNPERDSAVAAAVSEPLLSGSTGEPASPPRPGGLAAAARGGGDGRRAAGRGHAQQREHGEAGEHRTFATASTVAALPAVGQARPPEPGWEASLRAQRGSYVDTHRGQAVAERGGDGLPRAAGRGPHRGPIRDGSGRSA